MPKKNARETTPKDVKRFTPFSTRDLRFPRSSALSGEGLGTDGVQCLEDNHLNDLNGRDIEDHKAARGCSDMPPPLRISAYAFLQYIPSIRIWEEYMSLCQFLFEICIGEEQVLVAGLMHMGLEKSNIWKPDCFFFSFSRTAVQDDSGPPVTG